MKPANHFFSSLKHPIFSSFLLFFFALVFFTILLSCSEHGTDPNKPPKDPFEMTWTADTIAYEGSMQTLMTSMWASSPTDVWIAGHNDRSRGNIFHYNGIKWVEMDPMEKDIPVSPNSPNKIMGFSPNNVWIVGDRREYSRKDMIINWDGTKWKEHNLNLQVRPMSLFANRADDIWIGCDSAVVLHYNGTTWEKDIPRINIPNGSSYFINGIVVKDNNTFLNVRVTDVSKERYIHYFVKGAMKNWVVLDSMELKNPMSIIKWGDWSLSLRKDGKLYSYGTNGIWEYNGNNWRNDLSVNYRMHGIYALNENYKIAAGPYGIVWFFDGRIWKQIERFFTPDGYVHIYDAWTDGQELFLLGNTTTWPQKTIIWRGK